MDRWSGGSLIRFRGAGIGSAPLRGRLPWMVAGPSFHLLQALRERAGLVELLVVLAAVGLLSGARDVLDLLSREPEA